MTLQTSLPSTFDLPYEAPEGTYDEMLTPQGEVRPAWRDWLATLSSFSSSELLARWEEAESLLRENGVTFNVNGRDDGLDRPWTLDPFPLLLEAKEWQKVESGLQQRMRLFDAFLHDIYGPQRCLLEQWIPSPLIWGSPLFQRACHGIEMPADSRLSLHSVDLVRDKSGRFLALRDRVETPGGSGYALENRIALTRMVPEFFQTQAVRKLSPFFRALRDNLGDVAARFGRTSSIVFLTPGPASQTYFEQAYLAQFLGYPLVQGDDLTVRNNRVYLKLLEGLKPVDVIFRRLRDGYCDPLELRSDSVIGIPGLVQAVRAQNVAVVNSLGCALAEQTGLQAYLPTLCRRYLDEDLLLENVPTYWCGEPDKLDFVLNNLEKFVFKQTFSAQKTHTLFLSRSGELDEIRKKLLAEPEAFIARERAQLSTAPSFKKDRLVPRRVLLRTFTAKAEGEPRVLPGALALVSASEGSMIASLDSGSQSKDTWVLAGEDRGPVSVTRPRRRAAVITRGGDGIPSRAADNLFWLGRYLERAEELCRVLRNCFSHLTKDPLAPGDSPLPALLYYVSPRWNAKNLTREKYTERLFELLSEPGENAGLRVNLEAVRRLAGVLRDRISTETWTISNQLLEWNSHKPKTLNQALEMLNRLLTGCSACSGMISENMTRSYGWAFLDLGRRIERGIHTTAMLRRCLTTQSKSERDLLDSILEVTDTVRTYRRRYPGGLEPGPVLDLLLADPSHPRSIAFQLECIQRHVKTLPERKTHAPISNLERLLVSSSAALTLADPHELERLNKAGRRPELTKLLRDLGRKLPLISNELALSYLSHLKLLPQGPTFSSEILP